MCCRPFAGAESQNVIKRSGSLAASGRNNTALTTLKIAVFAPMPSASVSTAIAVNAGFFANPRNANRISLNNKSITLFPIVRPLECANLLALWYCLPKRYQGTALQSGALLVPQRHEWIDLRCASRRQITSQQRHDEQRTRHRRKRRDVIRA